MNGILKVSESNPKKKLEMATSKLIGSTIGGALGALSGARKREGETDEERKSRMIRRGIGGTMIGHQFGPMAGNLVRGALARRSGKFIPLGLKERKVNLNQKPLRAAKSGFLWGAASGLLNEGLRPDKDEDESPKDSAKRFAASALKGGASGAAQGAAMSTLQGLSDIYRGKVTP